MTGVVRLYDRLHYRKSACQLHMANLLIMVPELARVGHFEVYLLLASKDCSRLRIFYMSLASRAIFAGKPY